MCRSATCRRCGKKSWSGCGKHVDQVLHGVPAGQRCSCASTASSASAGDDRHLSRWGRITKLLRR